MIYKEHMIGYDVRTAMSGCDHERPADYKKHFLINEDVPGPKSVDLLLWQSQLRDDQKYGSLSPQKPLSLPSPSTLIAVTVVATGYIEEFLRCYEGVSSLEGPEGHWEKLGYDVADKGFISGLSNCGYSPDEKEKLICNGWREKINSNGLFSCADDAVRFSVLTNERVSEHAPFYVFGIYVVDQACLATDKDSAVPE